MNADRILALKLVGDVSSINRSMKQTQGRMRAFGSAAGSWMKAAGIGLAIEGVAKLGDALGDAWTGFRDGEKAAAQLGTTWKNFGLDGQRLTGTIDQISKSTLKLGTDDTEAINAFNEALKTTGGDSFRAMKRLALAQDLVANGSAPNLAAAMGIIRGAAKGSSKVVDKFGLDAETAGGRIKQLGQRVKGAAQKKADMDPLGVLFNQMNEDLEGIVGSLASGDMEGAMKSLGDIGTALSEAWDKVGPGVTEVIDKLTGGAFSEFVTWLGDKGRPIMEKAAELVDDFMYAWQNLQPVLSQMLTFVQPLIDVLSTTAEGGLGFIIDSTAGFVRLLGDLLKGDFTAALATAQEAIGLMWDDLMKIVGGIGTFLDTAAGDVLDSAAAIGQNIFDGIVGGIQRLVDEAKKLWNSLDFFLPPFVIPGIPRVVVPDPLGGSGFEVFAGTGPTRIWEGSGDLIPDLAKGGVIRHSPGGTLARIGEAGRDEAVIPLDRMGGMGGATYNINVNVAATADRVAIGKEIVEAIRQYERRSGKVWRTA